MPSSEHRLAGQLQADRAFRMPPGGLDNGHQVGALDLAGRHVGELGPCHRALHHRVDAAAVGAELGQATISGEPPDTCGNVVGFGADRGRQRGDWLGSTGAHRLDRLRKQSRVGLGMRRTAGADEGLSKDVVQRRAGPVDRDRAEQGAERERTVALRWRLVEGAGEQLGAAKRRIAGEGVGGACRGDSAPCARAFIAVARSCGSGALVMASA